MITVLICHTAGCVNENLAIPLVDVADDCYCGPCGETITDKTIQEPNA